MRYSTLQSPKMTAIGRLAGALACALILVPAAFAQMPAKPMPSLTGGALLSDGAVVDLGSSTLYLMNPAGLIEAVDLQTGSTLWTSSASAKPLAVAGGRLLAQGEPADFGELALLWFDGRGGELTSSVTAELPAGVWGGVTDGPNHGFRVRATRDGGVMSLDWMSTKTSDKPLQGYMPAADPGLGLEAKAASFDRRQGRLSLDLASGEVTAPLAGVKISFVSSILTEGQYVAPGFEARQFLSADGRHVLVSELISMQEGYRWSLYTRGGEALGEIEHRFSAAPFVVAGQTLILRSEAHAWMADGALVERPLALRVIDLSSGGELFAKALGSVEFAGPFPP